MKFLKLLANLLATIALIPVVLVAIPVWLLIHIIAIARKDQGGI
jgi:hypothetical protein